MDGLATHCSIRLALRETGDLSLILTGLAVLFRPQHSLRRLVVWSIACLQGLPLGVRPDQLSVVD